MTTVVGTGYTGARLLRAHASLRGISRSVPDGVDAGRITVVDLDEVSASIPGDDTLIYTVPPGGASGDARLAGLLSSLDATPARIVYISTTGVYGNRDGECVLETDPVNPQTQRAGRRVAAETLLTDYAVANNTTLVILRVPGIYGPGRIGLDRIRAGEPILRDDQANPGNR
ncbi:MAG: NAD-dependent epimerase/dehydratase family protein, partial [Pseudomonadota bacterium]